jgi:CBS domain-containing protein
VALGLLFGALASATAPAATVSVLWEYKARGVLTTMTYAIVALDDALAVILFSVCASLVAKLMGQGGVGLLRPLGQAAYELVGGAGLGAAAGAGLNFLLRRTRDYNKAFPFILSALLLLIGVGTALKVDTILAAMALGATLVNLAPRRSGGAFEIVERFAPPVYVLFFVMVGASLDIRGMPAWMWGLALPYVIGRTAGKMLGANFGARLAKAAPAVRKYLGLCLFSQGGVAVGLSIVASQRFAGPNGAAIITIIAVTTFIVEILGPPFVKLAIQRAGEAGLNVTEEDLMGSYRVGDMVDRESPAFAENTTVASMLRTIAGTDATCYPVTNADKKLAGVIRLQELKESFGGEGLADWLVALDVMQPVPDTITEDAPLAEAVARMREQQLDYLPVVKTDDNSILVGMLELRAVNRALTQEVLRRQRLADGEAT